MHAKLYQAIIARLQRLCEAEQVQVGCFFQARCGVPEDALPQLRLGLEGQGSSQCRHLIGPCFHCGMCKAGGNAWVEGKWAVA